VSKWDDIWSAHRDYAGLDQIVLSNGDVAAISYPSVEESWGTWSDSHGASEFAVVGEPGALAEEFEAIFEGLLIE
jgi:hypothetical protein